MWRSSRGWFLWIIPIRSEQYLAEGRNQRIIPLKEQQNSTIKELRDDSGPIWIDDELRLRKKEQGHPR